MSFVLLDLRILQGASGSGSFETLKPRMQVNSGTEIVSMLRVFCDC